MVVSVPDTNPTPAQIASSVTLGVGKGLVDTVYIPKNSLLHAILEVIKVPDEVWGRDYADA